MSLTCCLRTIFSRQVELEKSRKKIVRLPSIVFRPILFTIVKFSTPSFRVDLSSTNVEISDVSIILNDQRLTEYDINEGNFPWFRHFAVSHETKEIFVRNVKSGDVIFVVEIRES